MPIDSQKGRVLRVVGIAEAIVSSSPEDTLITYSLGSCLGVAVWDRRLAQGGMVHCLLPSAKSSPASSGASEFRFVDTGVAALLQRLIDQGSQVSDLSIRIAGGANPLQNGTDSIRIGERNIAMLRKLLWKNGILIAGEAVGGTEARTLSLAIGSGCVVVKTNTSEEEL